MTTSNTENLYVIYCVDGPCELIVEDPNGGRRKGGVHRMSAMEEHNAYQLATSSPNHDCYIHKVAVVPMLAADGVTMIGSCFMVKATRDECERFIQADPFSVKKVWQSVTINPFSRAVKPQEAGCAVMTQKSTGASHLYQSRRV